MPSMSEEDLLSRTESPETPSERDLESLQVAPLPFDCAAANRWRKGGELSLSQAENLFWLSGRPDAAEGERDEKFLSSNPGMLPHLPTPPNSSRLTHCPNCSYYGSAEQTAGVSCPRCYFLWHAPSPRTHTWHATQLAMDVADYIAPSTDRPPADFVSSFLPALSNSSPRSSRGRNNVGRGSNSARQSVPFGEKPSTPWATLNEPREPQFAPALIQELRALHRRAYIKPRQQERPAGAASRVPHVARSPSPPPAPSPPRQRPLHGTSPRPIAVPNSAAAMSASLPEPMPWLAGRATPPPPPPYVKPPTPPPVVVAAAPAPAAVRPKSPWTLEKKHLGTAQEVERWKRAFMTMIAFCARP